ncbi:hypothetical protein [Amycolatopsis sp. FDAARGOS 1241]|uniref:hypothetical protein n=1 Tax=Amycolatopsis sp. FDAARGOS 1241 TaxID=2778070 RepID=UPI00195151E8|nr:hypothetical protein [Amycolatopsis sp. FDAARGOS 1241]QRP44455.1 hypothetical protein I6J71_35120 [Amycolatopsis sp. FDAARGOS 1241]
MTPHDFTEHFVHARQAELRAAASRRRRPRSLHTPRQRLGWLLVHTGLRLVTDRKDRTPITLPA